MPLNTLGKRIKHLRKKQGLTQDGVAHQLGMNRPNLSNYEADRVIPPSDILSKLSDILGTSTDYLLGKKDNSLPAGAEKEFVNSLDLSDDDVLDKWDIEMDGEQLSKEQIKLALAFLRTLQQQERN